METDVVTATPADRDAVVATVVAAFAADPAFRFFFPDDATYTDHAATYARHLFDKRVGNGTVWVLADGAVTALWDLPGEPASPGRTVVIDAGTPLGALDLPADVRARLDRFDAAVHAALPAYPHWYLGILATHPDYAGRRLGRRLMGAGVTSAHADGYPAVLETMNPSNVELYQRAGWELYGQTAADDVPTTWVLINRPAVAPDPEQHLRDAA